MSAPVSTSADFTFFRAERATRRERRRRGKALRAAVPRESFAQTPGPDRTGDPLAVLKDQINSGAHERMATDPFAFLRGAAAVMAADLAHAPHSGITVQLCGDAQVGNFGMFASPERRLVFDLNDYAQTLAGPFEWDVKRLAASVAVAARVGGVKGKSARLASRLAAQSYRTTMATLSRMRTLDVWYARLEFEELVSALRGSRLDKASHAARKKSRSKRSMLDTLTEVADGRRRFRSDPPVAARIPSDEMDAVTGDLARVYRRYLTTLPPDHAALLTRFSYLDLARVGGGGSESLLLLVQSGDGEYVVLEVTEAHPSVLEPYLGSSPLTPAGKRVVIGQQVMQATPDPFLGWASGAGKQAFDCYVRQVRDVKGAIQPEALSAEQLELYARLCGAVLARAHARTGDASLISGYLGKREVFDNAVADFAVGYADVAERDHAAWQESLRSG